MKICLSEMGLICRHFFIDYFGHSIIKIWIISFFLYDACYSGSLDILSKMKDLK